MGWKHLSTGRTSPATTYSSNHSMLSLTNPPFGKKLEIDDLAILGSFQLGHKWTLNRTSHVFDKSSTLHKGQPPQILFVERCLELLRPGGRLGKLHCAGKTSLVLPPNRSHGPVHQVRGANSGSGVSARGIIPAVHTREDLRGRNRFRPTNHETGHPIFMGIAKWCGHDSRGLPIPHDDLPKILDKFMEYQENGP